jgi:hypothetical protein
MVGRSAQGKGFSPLPSSPLSSNRIKLGQVRRTNPATRRAALFVSQSTIANLIKYCAAELPKRGWTARSTDANFIGGANQYWKKGSVYRMLQFGYDQGELVIQDQYNQVDLKKVTMLPKDFPMWAQAEMVNASESTWDFYPKPDYEEVVANYTKGLAANGWKNISAGAPTYMGECGDPADCGNSPSAPDGAELLPNLTSDTRLGTTLVFTMADGNEISIETVPHQAGVIVYVEKMMKNLKSAGLPQDVPIYPAEVQQNIMQGLMSFEIDKDVDTIKTYYMQ